jgi:hypothetical protein
MFGDGKTVGNFSLSPPVVMGDNLIEHSEVPLKHFQGPHICIISRFLDLDRVQRGDINSGRVGGKVDIEPVDLSLEGCEVQQAVVTNIVQEGGLFLDVEFGAIDKVALFDCQYLEPQVHQKYLFGVVLQLYLLLKTLLDIVHFHQLRHFDILPLGVQLHVPQFEGFRSLAFLYVKYVQIVFHRSRHLEQFFVFRLLYFFAHCPPQLVLFNHVHFNDVPVEHCQH